MNALINWLREEWRLMWAHSWEGEQMAVDPVPHPCSSEDPRCAVTLARLKECRERMARMRSGLLDGRTFTNSASTDVAATIHKARTMTLGPLRAVRRAAR